MNSELLCSLCHNPIRDEDAMVRVLPDAWHGYCYTPLQGPLTKLPSIPDRVNYVPGQLTFYREPGGQGARASFHLGKDTVLLYTDGRWLVELEGKWEASGRGYEQDNVEKARARAILVHHALTCPLPDFVQKTEPNQEKEPA